MDASSSQDRLMASKSCTEHLTWTSNRRAACYSHTSSALSRLSSQTLVSCSEMRTSRSFRMNETRHETNLSLDPIGEETTLKTIGESTHEVGEDTAQEIRGGRTGLPVSTMFQTHHLRRGLTASMA